MDTYETLVIGGGPAGLSGALVLARSMRRVLLCDSGRYRNERSHALHCFLGHDGADPADLRSYGRAQLARYPEATMGSVKIASVQQTNDGFIARAEGGETILSRTVLVATGVVDELPRIPGFDALWGTSIHVCPYCDAWERRDAPIAIYGRGEKGAGLAMLLRQWTRDLVLCTDGPGGLSGGEHDTLRKLGVAVQETPIARLDGEEGQLHTVHFKDGTRLARRALFFNTGQHPRSTLLQRLGCAFRENGGVECDEEGRTSVPGIYVAGDVSRDVQLAIVAAAEGARAAIAINKDLLRGDGRM